MIKKAKCRVSTNQEICFKYDKLEMRTLMALAMIKHMFDTGRISEKMYMSIREEYKNIVDKHNFP